MIKIPLLVHLNLYCLFLSEKQWKGVYVEVARVGRGATGAVEGQRKAIGECRVLNHDAAELG